MATRRPPSRTPKTKRTPKGAGAKTSSDSSPAAKTVVDAKEASEVLPDDMHDTRMETNPAGLLLDVSTTEQGQPAVEQIGGTFDLLELVDQSWDWAVWRARHVSRPGTWLVAIVDAKNSQQTVKKLIGTCVKRVDPSPKGNYLAKAGIDRDHGSYFFGWYRQRQPSTDPRIADPPPLPPKGMVGPTPLVSQISEREHSSSGVFQGSGRDETPPSIEVPLDSLDPASEPPMEPQRSPSVALQRSESVVEGPSEERLALIPAQRPAREEVLRFVKMPMDNEVEVESDDSFDAFNQSVADLVARLRYDED